MYIFVDLDQAADPFGTTWDSSLFGGGTHPMIQRQLKWLFGDSSDVVPEVMFKELNIGYLWQASSEARNSRIKNRFVEVQLELLHYYSESSAKPRKTYLAVKNLALGVCTGLKRRRLTQAESETEKILAKMNTDKDRNKGWSGDKSDLITVERMHLSELRSVAAEISFPTGDAVGPVNTKTRSLSGLSTNLDGKGKGYCS